MKKKVKNIFVVLVIACAVFAILLTIENHLQKKNEKIPFVIALQDIPVGTHLTKENLSDFLEVRKCDAALDSEVVFHSLDEVKDLYVKNEVSKNTILIDSNLTEKNLKNKEVKNAVEVSFGVNALADGLVGTLRAGDVVRLYVLNAHTNALTEILDYSVIIQAAYDNAGNVIKEDETGIANNFTCMIDKKDESSFYESIASGNVKIVKVVDD